jgi:hypothetical protein
VGRCRHRPDGGGDAARPSRTVVSVAALLAVAVLGACGSGSADEAGAPSPPPAGAGWDYQIGGAYPPPSGASVVVRDRSEQPAGVDYDVCYVNGFQAQAEATDEWLDERSELVLHHDGEPVVDEDWDELLLDISTDDTREALAEIVGGWIEGCADDGFDAVEVDNLDSHLRSEGELDVDDALAFARLLVERAHRAGLAVGQKNAAELVARAEAIGFDFAVAEECGRFDECDAYVEGYGTHVLVVEYRTEDLEVTCERWPDLSIVQRDRDVVTPDDEGYVRATC